MRGGACSLHQIDSTPLSEVQLLRCVHRPRRHQDVHVWTSGDDTEDVHSTELIANRVD